MGYTKIDKEFCLTDDSVNVYGYRCLTKGLQLERFTPSIGFLMHNRETGVAVKWEDFRIDEGKLFAKPIVNEFLFPTLTEQIKAGFYAAASIGKIVALEVSDDAKYKLEGQTGVTVLKWFPRECSIVDIPGNYSALAQLYDESDNVLLDLLDQRDNNNLNNKEEMDLKPLSASDLKLLDLSDTATDVEVSARLQSLVDKATRCDVAESTLAGYKKTAETVAVNAILAQGLADKKLSKELSDKLAVDYADKSVELKALVDAMPAQALVTSELSGDVPAKFQGKSFEDLYLSGELAEVKKNYPDLYAELRSELNAD